MSSSLRVRFRIRAYAICKYPHSWPRVSRIIRRLAGGVCERCQMQCDRLEVHHLGSPYANGRPGDPRDKHDLRRENLLACCINCHDELEQVKAIRWRVKNKRLRRRAKLKAHRELGIGTGLILYEG